MTDPICPKTGAPMYRAERPLTLAYRNESVTFDMPGWYAMLRTRPSTPART
jgi:HTH-type transcriptional regulator/antitoxin MqsA